MTWDEVISSKQINSSNAAFLIKIPSLYDKSFEKSAVTSKTLKSHRMTKEILKSSKTRQRLYDKFSKSRTYEDEINYKNYFKLFESIQQRAKLRYYSKMILHYKDNIQKNFINMKEVNGKSKFVINSLPKHLILNYKSTFDLKNIADSFS